MLDEIVCSTQKIAQQTKQLNAKLGEFFFALFSTVQVKPLKMIMHIQVQAEDDVEDTKNKPKKCHNKQ